jgi:hypothetical protein
VAAVLPRKDSFALGSHTGVEVLSERFWKAREGGKVLVGGPRATLRPDSPPPVL